jgi:hypothetical protein
MRTPSPFADGRVIARRALLAIALLRRPPLPAPAFAATLEEAYVAYTRGDYSEASRYSFRWPRRETAMPSTASG